MYRVSGQVIAKSTQVQLTTQLTHMPATPSRLWGLQAYNIIMIFEFLMDLMIMYVWCLANVLGNWHTISISTKITTWTFIQASYLTALVEWNALHITIWGSGLVADSMLTTMPSWVWNTLQSPSVPQEQREGYWSSVGLPVLITLAVGDHNIPVLLHHQLPTPVHQSQGTVIVWLEEAMLVCKPAYIKQEKQLSQHPTCLNRRR